MQTLLKAVPESMFRLTDFALRTLAGFRKPLVYRESGFQKPLRKASSGYDNEYTFVLISGLLKGLSHS
jgi:hypothetical protein